MELGAGTQAIDRTRDEPRTRHLTGRSLEPEAEHLGACSAAMEPILDDRGDRMLQDANPPDSPPAYVR